VLFRRGSSTADSLKRQTRITLQIPVAVGATQPQSIAGRLGCTCLEKGFVQRPRPVRTSVCVPKRAKNGLGVSKEPETKCHQQSPSGRRCVLPARITAGPLVFPPGAQCGLKGLRPLCSQGGLGSSLSGRKPFFILELPASW
jgi:hypothetical protein